MTPGDSRGGIVSDDLSDQKSQNALKTGGGVAKKKKDNKKNKNNILKRFRPRGSVKLIKARAKPIALRSRSWPLAGKAPAAILLNAKSP